MAISSTSSSIQIQPTELVENIRKLLSPFAGTKKNDFAHILNLVGKLAGESPVVAHSKASGLLSSRALTFSSDSAAAAAAKAPKPNTSEIPDDLAYGYARGQLIPEVGLPAFIGWENPGVAVTPADMPQWNGKVPAGAPSGSVPVYSTTGYLSWLAPNGKFYDSLGRIEDTTLVHLLAERNHMSMNDYLTTIRAAVTAAGRPLTLRELYIAQAEDTGGHYATYKPVVTPDAERAAAVRAARTSPYGYSLGQTVPGTNLPAQILGDGVSELTAADMPAWDGRLPEHVPVGSIPFYSTNGALSWLAANGKQYDSTGMIMDNTTVFVWADRNGMSVDAFLAAVQSAGKTVGRALALGEVSSGGAGVSSSTRRVA